jgi:crotonobetainyl-CoA:carnitine CoA-transferase CaiB-like acyl-CoA transferase
MLRCKDGLIFVLCAEEAQWERFVKLMGEPEWCSWEVFRGNEARSRNSDALFLLLEEWLQQHTVIDVFEMAAQARLPFTPVSTVGDLVRFDHLRIRGFFVTAEHPAAGMVTYPGAPYKLEVTPWRLRRPAPLLGQHNAEIYGRLGIDEKQLSQLSKTGIV